MNSRTWIIVGATSIIAKHFAHIAAKEGHDLLLVGRDAQQLALIAQDIRLRFPIVCDVNLFELDTLFASKSNEFDLFIAHSQLTPNTDLDAKLIKQLLEVNVITTSVLVHSYLQRPQKKHHLIYLSSVAACRGRAKNSLYGASKAAIEIYLEGLQQMAKSNQHISIARLGFIDTHQTYGLSGAFYCAHPKACAQACWEAVNTNKRLFYYPRFWRIMMFLIRITPFFVMSWVAKYRLKLE